MHVVDKAFVHNLLKFYMHISYRLVGQKGFDFRKKNKARWESWCPTQASITSQLRRQEMKNQPKLPPNCTDATTLVQHWWNTRDPKLFRCRNTINIHQPRMKVPQLRNKHPSQAPPPHLLQVNKIVIQLNQNSTKPSKPTPHPPHTPIPQISY